ncbi:galactonate dehydratase [Acrocarpospora macrocephala]|uniref:Galactonate dehydratase n=1 Tax=Acrocarpospora macrocephala TaxID=150177 RepID=A0A5M3X4X2_9ACTN|nr:galactonate dehydratase [Acrocarpospora macrocephala]GES13883.1 galactonate dehydratase [Acrocarpospora macrocephala]
MKITRVETFLIPPRWLFCRVETDEGHVGWGEPVVEGRADSVRAAVGEIAELLVGADPLRIEDHWQVMTKGSFYRGGPVLASAVAGLDQALWDIAGKARGVPVHELLGGPVREHVRAYTWIGGDEPGRLKEEAQRQVEAGFTAVKMNASGRMSPIAGPGEIDEVIDRVAAAREVLGPGRDVAVDFHGRVSYPNARRLLPLLEPFTPMFVEEPVVPESMTQVRSLVEASNIPIALGERLYSRWDFQPAFQAGIAVAQPDLSHAGGISEVRRIAAQAEVYGALLAPHCPLGPLSLAASLQVAFATPNFLIQEQSIGIHYHDGNELLDYLVDPSVFAFTDGLLPRPTGPGLGVVIDEARVREADRRGHAWRSPVWRYPDSSFAEW